MAPIKLKGTIPIANRLMRYAWIGKALEGWLKYRYKESVTLFMRKKE